MGEVSEDVEPLLAELTTLMEHLERTSGFPDAVGLDHAKLGTFCSRRRERLQVKAPPHAIVALILDGEKRVGRSLRVQRGEVLLIPAGLEVEVINIPASPRRPYRAFVVQVAPQVAALLATRHTALVDTPPPWAGAQACALRPSRSAVLAALHLARSLLEPGAHLELLRHRLEDVLLSLLLASGADLDGAPRSHARHDPVGAIRHLIRREPDRSWRVGAAAARLGMSAQTLRRRLAAAHTSFREVLIDERMRLARTLLRDRTLSVLEVALRCGYQSPSKFAAQFERALGTSPSRFAQGEPPA